MGVPQDLPDHRRPDHRHRARRGPQARPVHQAGEAADRRARPGVVADPPGALAAASRVARPVVEAW
ncbi:hypothetical protein [Amycolatopsis sp.]|uniref:hypothetical protein n=1 Tax=Amycolatopsis sp. TaxID=37632 RepID=UPI002CA6676F|nr:hypothetical protein [Amycolatopsis sp.]HVV14268.1 hypothetical protein [Amycolatopsis sp.]